MGTETQSIPHLAFHQTQSVHNGPTPTKIPLVAHIITDDDIGLLQGAKLEAMNLNRAVKLLTDPHSSMLYDRHVHALKKVVKRYKHGFPMKDLVQVFKILNVCADRVDTQPLYEMPMCNVIHLCGCSYLKEKSSDELTYEQIIVESVSQLGYLMRVMSPVVRKKICQTLTTFFTNPPATAQAVQPFKPSSVEFNETVIESSDVSETLVKSLMLIENDTDVRIEVLKVLQQYSRHSAKNCNQMLLAKAAEKICVHMMEPDSTGQLLFRSVEILWNLLENGDKQEVSSQLNNLDCIRQLQDAFVYQLTQGYSHYDRQLRNDLLVITSLVASNCPEAPFIETGFTKQLILFATFQEVKSHSALVKHLKLSQNHEDFELKKLLLSILVILCKDSAAIPLMSEGHLMLSLLSYVRANDSSASAQEWLPAQFEELQLLAMASLCTLSPLMLEDYMTCQGSTRLLLLLEWCVSPDDFGGHGNSFYGTGGRGNKRAQMRFCLRLLRSIASTGSEVALQDLADQGAIHQVTSILTSATQSNDEDDSVDIEMQTDMLIILSCLCEYDGHRKELFANAGVDVVIAYLKTNASLIMSGLGHHRLLLSTLDCIWCSIVSCYTTEDYFLECEGVFLLLDLLELCPKNMHNLILGCLLDLCENPKTFQHVLAWRGKNGATAPHLLCEIWRSVELTLGVQRDATGAITALNAPLKGKFQAEMEFIPLPSTCASQAIVDVSENMRAKIYALFCKLGVMDLPGLCVDDHVTLSVIEKYLDFKNGEVWSEVIGELEKEEVRPVTPDQEAIEAISRAMEDRAAIVQATQKELFEAQLNQDKLEEQEFYAEIRENHRQKEKALTDFVDFVTRTSNYELLKAAKERQELSIDASRLQTKYKDLDNFHSTEITIVQTTAFSGRHVVVDSTPLTLTGGPLAKYDPLTGTLQERKVY